ncbi:MAG: VOC family protein [Boseongicola sp.]|nr:MAG: VOC family protein [Boseongicola sp.]
MAQARLEHVNLTVTDPKATAAWIERIFGWKIRWQGAGMQTGHTIHIGEDDTYLALFTYGDAQKGNETSYHTVGGLNHVAVVVDDLDATEQRVIAEGFTPKSHADYEPGRRFYFYDGDGIEFEVVQYD